MRRPRVGVLIAMLSLCALTAACGGGGSSIILGPLLAVFAPDAASADPRISMQAGAAAGEVFTVEIQAGDIDDLAGVAFTLLYDSALVGYLGCQAQGSILLSNPALANSCDNTVVGGASFSAALQNGTPGILNVGASLVGLVAGVADGTGLVLTLTFETLAEIPAPGSQLDFEAGASREVQTCDLSSCAPAVVAWDAGSVTAVPL